MSGPEVTRHGGIVMVAQTAGESQTRRERLSQTPVNLPKRTDLEDHPCSKKSGQVLRRLRLRESIGLKDQSREDRDDDRYEGVQVLDLSPIYSVYTCMCPNRWLYRHFGTEIPRALVQRFSVGFGVDTNMRTAAISHNF